VRLILIIIKWRLQVDADRQVLVFIPSKVFDCAAISSIQKLGKPLRLAQSIILLNQYYSAIVMTTRRFKKRSLYSSDSP
jgi:hypothetical protein